MKDENGNEYECNIQHCPAKATRWLESTMPRLNLGPICEPCWNLLEAALRVGGSLFLKKPPQHLPKREGQ